MVQLISQLSVIYLSGSELAVSLDKDVCATCLGGMAYLMGVPQRWKR